MMTRSVEKMARSIRCVRWSGLDVSLIRFPSPLAPGLVSSPVFSLAV